MGDLAYNPVMQVFTSDGDPGVGYKLYTYEPNSSTAKVVYTNKACTVAATNPVVFNARGEAEIYGFGHYKFILKTDADVTVWTVLDVSIPGGSTSFATIDTYSNDLTAAISAIGSTDTTLFIDDTATISEAAVIPSTLRLKFLSGGTISHGAYTITVNSILDEGPYQIFNGTGIVSLSNKEIYPEWFGSLSSTVDSASVIDKALNSMPTDSELVIRSKVAVGAGGWTGLTVDTQRVSIIGLGRSCGFKVLAEPSQHTNGSSKVCAVLVDTVDGFKMNGIEIDANSVDCNAFAMDTCTNCLIEENYIHDTGTSTGANGMYCEGGVGNKYINNHVKDNAGRGMWIGNVGASDIESNAVITGNLVEDNGYSGICGQHQYTVIGNNICRGNAGSGIVDSASANATAHDNTIVGNVCENNSFHGIQPGDTAVAYFPYSITITGNVCRYNDYSGIFLNRTENVTCSGNVCYNNNILELTNSSGITVYGHGKAINITGNHCFDTGSGATRTQAHGIYVACGDDYGEVDEEMEDILISSNICKNNLTHGIYLTNVATYSIDSAIISNNICRDNGTNGIFIADSAEDDITNLVVMGNICLDNTNDFRLDDTISAYYPFNKFSTKTGASTQHGYGYDTATGTYSITDPNTTTLINSSGGAVTATLDDGTRYGQRKMIVMTNATASSTVSVTHHETSDPEVITFAAVDDTAILEWTGTEWITIKLSGASV